MAAVPALMVIYTNDAVEVRYSDGSRLELSPCGSAIKHYYKPDADAHPISGYRSVQQRTRFVTSQFRHKVLQAVDFRNRFAEIPYVCQELLHKDEVMSLYSDIRHAAWPKESDKANIEYLPDGGVRIFSLDEYASLVLSPHRQEFTVCYLSKLSKDSAKTNKESPTHVSTSYTNNSSGFENDDQVVPEPNSENNRSFTDDEKLRASPNIAKSDVVCAACRVSTPTDEINNRFSDGIEITPYGKSAFVRVGNTDPVHDLSSISKTSSEGLCTTIDVDTTLNPHQSSSVNNPDHSCGLDKTPKKKPDENQSAGSEKSQSKKDKCKQVVFSDSTKNSSGNLSKESAVTSSGELDSSGDVKCRHLYSWVTRHFSCNECPLSWRHPLKLATEAAAKKKQTGENESEHNSHPVKGQKLKQPNKIPLHLDKKKCTFTSLPRALPLSCPFQHKHKWNVLDDTDTLQGGVLKVMLIDGAVYRIIHMAAMNMIEVYPGDGSVFISQGISGHYFSNIQYSNGQVVEKSFSLKALPPQLPGSSYSVEKLLKRAQRLLIQAIQNDKMSSAKVNPCWKQEEIKIVEPLPVVLLEECHIPGWGKFTAYTNGRVRIVFEDRTSMDLLCDFTKRIQECVGHSDQSEELIEKCDAARRKIQMSVTGLDSEFGRDTCRILLPSGKYVLVDLHKPGIYQKYVNQALEWASWVNSSPLERQKFYNQLHQPEIVHLSAEAELKKISCFNYITDQTAAIRDSSYQTMSSSRSPSLNPLSNHLQHRQETQIHNGRFTSGMSGPIESSFAQMTASGMSGPMKSGFAQMTTSQQKWPPMGGNTKTLEMLQGFNSVRQALLQTNKLIKDIDEILEKKD